MGAFQYSGGRKSHVDQTAPEDGGCERMLDRTAPGDGGCERMVMFPRGRGCERMPASRPLLPQPGQRSSLPLAPPLKFDYNLEEGCQIRRQR